MFAWLSKLPAPILYVVSVALEKSFALITIPLMAAYLSPESYGYFDVAVALSEVVILIFGLGLTEQLIRFASTANTRTEESKVSGEIMGCALVIALTGAAIALFIAPTLKELLSLEIGLPALMFMLVAACLNNLIVLPMTWLRLKDDAGSYLCVVLLRTLAQVCGIALALTLGLGADGVLISNGVVLTVFALVLTLQQSRVTPFRISLKRFAQIGSYGAPLLGAMLAMFLLGSANRLFLSQSVSPEMMGQFGLASRLALATALLLYPLELWWLPKRIAVLKSKEGLQQSADVWGIGVAILILSATGVALLAPVFISAFLPIVFVGAIAILPFLVFTESLHALSGLTEVGSYAREAGYRVLMIDSAGAIVAVVGFILLIPEYGAYGAITSVAAAQLFRIAAYVADGKALAPITYRWWGTLACSVVAVGFVNLAPNPSDYMASIAWTVFATLSLAAIALLTGLVRPTFLMAVWFRRGSIEQA